VTVVLLVVAGSIFLLADFIVRRGIKKATDRRLRREREEALRVHLNLDFSHEAKTLRRVEVEKPKARILAVDDEEVILDSFRKILVLAGYSIDTVESGSEALGLIRKNDYDFVFTDLKMPEMDGVEVTKAVRHLRPDIDVIVITGYASIESAVETVKFGAMDYVQKPFTEDELLEFVKTAVIKRQHNLEKQMRHKIRLIKPGTPESKSRFELNVPAGAFVSKQHAWARIELNGAVCIGLDDLIRKLFTKIDRVELPEPGKNVERGAALFSLSFGEHTLTIPSPLSGKVISVNSEQIEHPEWLSIKPFELSWMCRIEPSNLAGELPGLKIGVDAVNWYQQELDRYSELANSAGEGAGADEAMESGKAQPELSATQQKLLVEFSKPFLQ